MLDIELFRKDPEVIRDSEKRRFKDTLKVEQVIELDNKWRDVLKKTEELKHRRNVVSREIADLKKAGKKAEAKIKEMRKINKEIAENDMKANDFLKKRDDLRYSIGNILHKDVPVSENEEDNRLIRTWGKPRVWKDDVAEFKKESRGKMDFENLGFRPKSHVDVLEQMDLGDIEKAAKVSGARFYYLKNELALLNMALIKFATDFMFKKGFTPMWTPFVLQREAVCAAAELGDFENTLYKLEGENLFLIATAEQTLAAYHMNETFNENELPKTYVGFSTNFRREAGSHGKDTKGIFRVHQFDKVEQFIFCKPEDSWEWFEKLIKNAEEIYQKLEIPYRVMSICSGEMNDNAAMKYDLEAWMPVQGKFREVVSCSNCTDYQPRKLNVKVTRKDGTKEILHTLNSTLVATGRTIVAIIENFQQKDGTIKIPKALVPYAGFKEIRR